MTIHSDWTGDIQNNLLKTFSRTTGGVLKTKAVGNILTTDRDNGPKA